MYSQTPLFNCHKIIGPEEPKYDECSFTTTTSSTTTTKVTTTVPPQPSKKSFDDPIAAFLALFYMIIRLITCFSYVLMILLDHSNKMADF